MEFTYYNDLSLEYLASRVLDDQKRLVAMAKDVCRKLAEVGDHEAHRLVEALLASLRQYTGLMEELLAPHRVAVPGDNSHRRARNYATKSENYSVQSQTAA
jgi:hypothetical protein